MRVHVLGSAAGGGVPQWNCRCSVCQVARTGPQEVRSRLHAALAVSANGMGWVLCNATPDIHRQIEQFPALLPAHGLRGSSIGAVILTGADLDQVLGLLLLREGEPLPIYGTPRVRQALSTALRLLPALDAYCGALWRDLPLDTECQVAGADGGGLGVRCRAFAVAGGPPPYAGRREDEAPGDTVGLELSEGEDASRLVYLPSCGALPDALVDRLSTAACLFFDGTLWRDDEITDLGVGGRTGRAMRHLPLSGAGGSLDRLRDLRCRRILTHINNTNPMLVEGGPEQALVRSLGWEIAHDGLELEVV